MSLGPGILVNGKYRLVRKLGEGGMGTIFEARHEFLGTEVALKFLHPALSSRPNVVARFVQEARVSANIRSPHVVSVVDVDQSPEGLAFLVMELLHGEPLAARLSREPTLPLPLACTITVQVLLALEIAHNFGVVHRDMKPENVFLTDAPDVAGATSDGLLVKILDFGIAKLRTLGEVKAQLTRPGVVMGTPEYMAPEQVFAADAVDARADIYAVGAMLFEMLAGQRPIPGEDARAIAAQVMSGATPRLDKVAPRIPAPIADVVAIALAAQPTDRFSSAAAMRKALVNAARESEVALEVPATAPRTRANLPAADVVLGSAGLGLAPPAMLGPGDPAAMAAYDAKMRGVLPRQLGVGAAAVPPTNGHREAASAPPPAVLPTPPSAGISSPPSLPQIEAAAKPPAPLPGLVGSASAPPPIPAVEPPRPAFEATAPHVPHGGLHGGPHGGLHGGPQGGPPRGTAAMAAMPDHDHTGTLAAMPSPYAPPYGDYPGGDFQGTAHGHLAPAMPTPPTPTEGYAVESRAGRRVPWLPIVAGISVVAAVVLVLVWVAQPSRTTAAPPPPPAATEEEPTPTKKKPKPTADEPEPPPSATAKPTTAPTFTGPKPPTSVKPPPSGSASGSKIPPLPSGFPSGFPSTFPSTSTTPKPSGGPDIITIPLPWPPPT